jgi:hypothetical protein
VLLEALTQLRDLLIEEALLVGSQERTDALTVGFHEGAVTRVRLVTRQRLAAERLVLRATFFEHALHRGALRVVETERVDHAAQVRRTSTTHRAVASTSLAHAIGALTHAARVKVEHALLVGAKERADALTVGLHDRAVLDHALLAGELLTRERFVLRVTLGHDLPHLRGLRCVEAEATDHVLHALLEALLRTDRRIAAPTAMAVHAAAAVRTLEAGRACQRTTDRTAGTRRLNDGGRARGGLREHRRAGERDGRCEAEECGTYDRGEMTRDTHGGLLWRASLRGWARSRG